MYTVHARSRNQWESEVISPWRLFKYRVTGVKEWLNFANKNFIRWEAVYYVWRVILVFYFCWRILLILKIAWFINCFSYYLFFFLYIYITFNNLDIEDCYKIRFCASLTMSGRITRFIALGIRRIDDISSSTFLIVHRCATWPTATIYAFRLAFRFFRAASSRQRLRRRGSLHPFERCHKRQHAYNAPFYTHLAKSASLRRY